MISAALLVCRWNGEARGRAVAKIEHVERPRHAFADGTLQPGAKLRGRARERRHRRETHDGAIVLDKRGRMIGRERQRERFGQQRIGPDAVRTEPIEPRAQRRARNDRNADRVARAFGRGEVQILDWREQLILDREWKRLHELRAALRRDARFGQQHVFGWHQDDDLGDARDGGRRWPAARRAGGVASVRALPQPVRIAGGIEAQQQTIGHGRDLRKPRRL